MEAERIIQDRLRELSDGKYRDFQLKLTPGVTFEQILGVRIPDLKKYAVQIKNTELAREFIAVLPHRYYDENHLHSFLISYINDKDELIRELDRFLPFVDNWATCDSLRPKLIAKKPEEFLPYIYDLLGSEKPFSVRFGIGLLMSHFLGNNYSDKYSADVAKIRSDEYYVNMMKAWYFATALAKQYESAVVFIENRSLDVWTHNKAIQKACESFRVTQEHKEYLRTLKIR